MPRKENHGSGRKEGNSGTDTRRSASTGGKQMETGLSFAASRVPPRASDGGLPGLGRGGGFV